MLFYCISLTLILTIITLFIHFKFKKLQSSLDVATQSFSTSDERARREQLTSYELERLEREEEFDKRINRLKEELANQQSVIRKGVLADELHPSVYNIPHDAIDKKIDVLPDVEVAE